MFIFPSYSKAVLCTLSHLFVRFGLYSGFCLLCVPLAFHVHLLLLFGQGAPAYCWATLKSGIRNWKETKNQNSQSTNQRKQVLQIGEKLLRRDFTFKHKRASKKVLKQNSLQPLFLVRVLIMRI